MPGNLVVNLIKHTFPSVVSLFPCPYHGALSIKLIPDLKAFNKTSQDSLSSVLRYILPNGAAPVDQKLVSWTGLDLALNFVGVLPP